jgi:WD40 repeat protein
VIRREPDAIRHDGGMAETASPATGAAPRDATDVFISYNRRDSAPAEHIASFLRDAGLRVFFDRWTLDAGQAWTGAIEEALNTASAVLVLLGPAGMGDWQRAESDLALDRQRRGEPVRVLPVLLRGADPPLGFLRLNTWVDLSAGHDDRSVLQHLVTVVRGGTDGQAPVICPYRGLRPFRQEDAAFFFGRDAFVARVAGSVQRKPVTAVAGASGSGKSSAIFAGLLPHLRADPAQDWTFVTMRPGREPFHALAANIDSLTRPLTREENQLSQTRALGDAMRSATIPIHTALGPLVADNQRVLVFVDQWEELYTICDNTEVRTAFIDALLDAAGDRVSVLFTVRGDYFDDVLEHRRLADQLQDGLVNIGPMTADELRSCIEGPAHKVGLSFEEGLVDTILADVAGEAGSLPLLEFVLTELWERRRGTWLVTQAYAAIGGLRGAIADRAEDVLASFGPDSTERDLVKRVMLELVSVGAGGETRRRATRAEIGEDAWRVVPALADARLLVTSHDDATGDETAEVAHEALIRHWDRLRAWLDEDREFLLWHQRLRAALESYASDPGDDGTLLRGSLLHEAVRWREARQHRLPEREIAYIAKSEKRARRLHIRRITNAAFLVLAVIALSFAAVRFRSVRLRNIEMRHASILEAAAAERDPLVAALLVAELDVEREPPSGARIARAIADRAIPAAVLANNRDGLMRMMITPDGSQIVTAYADGQVLLWDANGGRPEELVPPGDPLRDVRLDDAGRLLALVSDGGALRVFDIEDRIDVRPWRGPTPNNIALAHFGAGTIIAASHDGAVAAWPLRGGGEARQLQSTRGPDIVLASADGNRIAIVTDSVIETWLLVGDGIGAPATLRGHRARIATAALNRSGSLLVTGSYNGEVRAWNLTDRSSREIWNTDGSAVWSVALDSAAQRFVAAAADGRVCDGSLIDVAAAPVCHTHDGEATVARLSPDGRQVLSGGTDSTVLVRPSGVPTPVTRLRGHRETILDAAYSVGGARIATASLDGEIRVWAGALRGDPLDVRAVRGAATIALNEDASTIALAGYDGSVRVIRTGTQERFDVSVSGSPSAIAMDGPGLRIAIGTTGGHVHVRDLTEMGTTFDLPGHAAYVTSVAFDPTGTRIVSASVDSTLRLWSGTGFENVTVLSGHTDLVHGGAFDPSGARIVSYSEDGTARIWSAAGDGRPLVLGHQAPVRYGAFSSAGDRIATAAQDGSINIWTIEGDSVQTLRGHEGAVSFVTFDARGNALASASADQTARIWSLDRSEQPAVLRGHRKHVRTARFSPDGLRVVTSSLDSTARVHTLGETGDAIALAHGSELRDAIFVDDGKGVLTIGEDGRVLLWRIGWAGLLEYLGSATTACLGIPERVRFLAESPHDAAEAHEDCAQRQVDRLERSRAIAPASGTANADGR